LKSFAEQYQQRYPSVNASTLMKLLWGDYYYNSETRKFMKKPTKFHSQRVFVQFILEPLYKIMTHSVSHEKPELEKILSTLGIYLRNEIYRMNTKDL
jgi:U5 small nuclear ribonucleoprotein component